MRLVWRCAVAFAERGWPVLPWDGGALEPFASADPAVVAGWGVRYGDVGAACDLEAAGLFVVRVDAGFMLTGLFDPVDRLPAPGGLTTVDGEGRWLWWLRRPVSGVSGGWLVPMVEVVTGFVPVPGSREGGRVEHDADLVAAECPGWLADLV